MTMTTFKSILKALTFVLMLTLGSLCQAQTFDFVGYTGSTGVGFADIFSSTRLSKSKFAFFEYPSTLLKYDVNKKQFTREPLLHFTQHDYVARGMVVTRGLYVFLVYDRNDNNGTRLVCVDKNRNLVNDFKLTAQQTFTGGSRFVLLNERTVRYISSTGFEEVDIFSGKQTSIPYVFPDSVTDYRTDNGKHYVSTETGVFELRADGATSVIALNVEAKGLQVQNGAVSFVNANTLEFVRISRNVKRVYPYPTDRINNEMPYWKTLLCPEHVYMLDDDTYLLHNNSILVTATKDYIFKDRYGSIDAPEWRCKDAVDQNGNVAVGRAGYVSFTVKNVSFNVPIRTSLDIEALPTAITFATQKFATVSYVNYFPSLHSGILVIDIEKRKVVGSRSLPFESIADIDFRGNIYILGDGQLWTVDLELTNGLCVIPNVGGNEVSAQNGYVYVTDGARYVKLDVNNNVVRSDIQSATFEFLYNFYGYTTAYTHLFPDESVLIEYLGYVDKNSNINLSADGSISRTFFPPSFAEHLGNGKGNYIVIGTRHKEVYKYNPL